MLVTRLALLTAALLAVPLTVQARTQAHSRHPRKSMPRQHQRAAALPPAKKPARLSHRDDSDLSAAPRSFDQYNNFGGDNGSLNVNRLPSSVLFQPLLPTHGMHRMIGNPPLSTATPSNQPKRFYVLYASE